MLKRNLRPWLLAIGVIPLALTLTGCFGIPNLPGGSDGGNGGTDEVDEEFVEDIVEGGTDSDVDFESGSLPADFPVGDIPLVPGEVGPSMSISNGAAWTVTIYTEDEETAASAAQLLEDAGFNNESVFAWENEEYLVVIVASDQDDEGRWYVYYQIQRQQ
ncbi:hypothetical protein [Pseudolysinimonas yzui]|uniref:Uncharacterized protein n=1 Tax=Pseudolysinimonas yzui TaxID=2708254 RepID=A0A8J3M1C8_9MICO|nr:hypothetical protein [Pseudolysinimonas yzui]GHF18080.1 hypothetical protein GCM10011600_18760 [Pseudolysinimonas yzui]